MTTERDEFEAWWASERDGVYGGMVGTETLARAAFEAGRKSRDAKIDAELSEWRNKAVLTSIAHDGIKKLLGDATAILAKVVPTEAQTILIAATAVVDDLRKAQAQVAALHQKLARLVPACPHDDVCADSQSRTGLHCRRCGREVTQYK